MAHTTPTARLVFTLCGLGKGAMKNSESIANGINFFDDHLSFFYWKSRDECFAPLRKDCLTGIGHEATEFVAAFPIVNER